MTHPFATYFRLDDFHPTFLAHDPAVFHSFVFTAITFIVLDRAEYLGTKKAVPFRLEGSVIDGFRLLDLAIRSLPNFFGRRDRDLNGIIA
jgi:hypothetical protein